FLADAESPVGSLIFDGRVPPAIEMNDVVCRREIESAATGFEGDDEEGRSVLGLKGFHELRALAHRCATVEDKPAASEDGGQKVGQGLRDCLELCEQEQFFLTFRDRLAQQTKAF